MKKSSKAYPGTEYMKSLLTFPNIQDIMKGPLSIDGHSVRQKQHGFFFTEAGDTHLRRNEFPKHEIYGSPPYQSYAHMGSTNQRSKIFMERCFY